MKNTRDMEGRQDTFRDIDLAFAKFISRLAPEDPPEIGLAALLVSRATGEGHVCIDVSNWSGREIRVPGGAFPRMRCPSADEWRHQLRSSPLVGSRRGNRPLVCDDRGRVYLQRLYQHEQDLAEALRQKATGPSPGTTADRETLKRLLARYFPARADGAPDWQAVAAEVALLKGLCIISGGPGTGKTTTVAKIIGVLMESGGSGNLRVRVCAPTGKAAARLGMAFSETGRSLDAPPAIAAALTALEPRTIHRLLRTQPGGKGFYYDETNPLPADIVVVDEASMVDLVLMSRLLKAVPRAARLIILGDKDQLSSVEAGSVFGDLCRGAGANRFARPPGGAVASMTKPPPPVSVVNAAPAMPLQDCIVVLQKNFRFHSGEGIGALTRAVHSGDKARVRQVLAQDGDGAVCWEPWHSRAEFHKILAGRVLKGYEGYLGCRTPDEALTNFNAFMVLCALASGPFGVDRINIGVADLLQKAGLIGRSRPWYPGRPVMILRNDYRIGLFNGDVGIAWHDAAGRLKIWFRGEGGDLRALSPQRLPEHQTVFAMTVHKSQGSEFERALLVLPDQDFPVLTRELVYTGCSRARRQLILAAPGEILDRALDRTTQRRSGLYEALWSPLPQIP